MNINFLPWYDSIEKQNRYLHQVKGYESSFKLSIPSDRMIPFQFRVKSGVREIESCHLMKEDGTQLDDLISNSKLKIKTTSFNGFDVISCDGKSTFSNDLPYGGPYYLRMSNGVSIWYSELFYVDAYQDLSKMLKIETDCDNDLGDAIFQDGFSFWCYLKTDLGTPSYEYIEDGIKKDGIFLPVKQLVRKEYKFTTYVPEFLCDALNAMRVNDNIIFTSKIYGELRAVEMSIENPKWQGDGGFSLLDISFKTDWQIKKTSISFNNQKVTLTDENVGIDGINLGIDNQTLGIL